MDTTILEDLGLTQAEIKVYLALLELSTATAGPLLEKSGLQNSVVHRALNTLIEKSLINYIQEGKRKVYQATDPENFYGFIDEKKRKFKQILPELKKKQGFAKKTEKATVFKGKRGINEVYTIMISSRGKEYNTFGGGNEVTNKIMGEHWWKNLHLKRIANKLPSRQVFDKTISKFGKELNKKRLTKIKFLPHQFAQLTETVIVGNKVAVAVFTENPYAFLIEDKVVADGYRKHFKALWNLAK
jgi:HTH-type transcriptional regulator, sugar sensing transcriptional regulator